MSDDKSNALDHEGIIPLHFHAPSESRVWLVAEEPECLTLAEVVAERGAFKLKDALTVFYQIADMVTFLHDHGAMHGVLFPETIFCESGNRCMIGITDKECTPDDRDRLHYQLREWSDFIAPELRGGAVRDSRCDVYSLGVLLNWLLTRKATGGISSKIPRQLVHVIQQAIVADPTQRTQTISGLVDQLKAFREADVQRMQDELQIAMQSRGLDPRLVWVRHPRKTIAALVLFCLACGLGVWAKQGYDKKQAAVAEAARRVQEQRDRIERFHQQFAQANELYKDGVYTDAVETYRELVDAALDDEVTEAALANIARSYGFLKDFGAEYTAWLRLLQQFPDTALAGEANERIIRIAALSVARYGDLLDITTDQEIIVDGISNDWGDIEPVITDPKGDNSRGGPPSDLIAFFAGVKDGIFYFRFDTAAPPHEGDQYCIAFDLNAFAYDDATEEWDFQLGVAKGIQPWIWDLRGNRNYDNTKSNPLHGVVFVQNQCVEGSLPLSAIGSPTSAAVRVFINFQGTSKPTDVCARKVLLKWQKKPRVDSVSAHGERAETAQ